MLADASGAKTRALRLAGSPRSLPVFRRPEYTAPLLDVSACVVYPLRVSLAVPTVLPDSAYSVFAAVCGFVADDDSCSAQENGSSLLLFLFFVGGRAMVAL